MKIQIYATIRPISVWREGKDERADGSEVYVYRELSHDFPLDEIFLALTFSQPGQRAHTRS